jgi:UDP-N-acetylmuramyl pentapeptide phosphotransferase/UDP-N-acetylglucosamine-1-phosphate transferase
LANADNTLLVRAFILVLGASLALAGMATETSWLINVAIGVIVVGLILAIYRRRKREEPTLEE